jgi:hypothetical protein
VHLLDFVGELAAISVDDVVISLVLLGQSREFWAREFSNGAEIEALDGDADDVEDPAA